MLLRIFLSTFTETPVRQFPVKFNMLILENVEKSQFPLFRKLFLKWLTKCSEICPVRVITNIWVPIVMATEWPWWIRYCRLETSPRLLKPAANKMGPLLRVTVQQLGRYAEVRLVEDPEVEIFGYFVYRSSYNSLQLPTFDTAQYRNSEIFTFIL